MPSLLPGYEYDIFISYRQKDNRYDGWVTEFVQNLKKELDATLKEDISIYFDTNPHDGLLETHNVDKSLEGKLKCLIFIPIISQTYCDTKSFAWQHEFCVFNKLASKDQFGRDIKLSSGNVASRILPVKIHDLDVEDTSLLENELDGVLRAIEFIYKESGVNRPLKSTDNKNDNQNKSDYRNQVNKAANAIKELLTSLKNPASSSAPITGYRLPVTDNLRSRIRKKLIITLLLLATIVSTYFLYPTLFSSVKEDEARDKSIAVLPFVNMSNDPEQEYFSDGITEDIITQVSKISDLKVISRTSVMQYKATDKTSRQIGKELDVATILEGSVRREGNQIRVVAQLIDARTNEHLWAETYDKELTHMFAIQSNVAEQIASALKAKLTQTDKEGIEKKPTENPAAYDLYLRGKFHLREDSRQEIDSAIMIIEQAVATDSKFALAYVALAGAYNEIFFTYEANKKWSELAFVALEKALAIDPSLPEAYVVRARLLWTHEKKFPHAQAVAELRHVLSLRPNFGEARVFLSVIFAHIGLYDKAFEEVQKALELNPLDLATQTQLGDQFYYVQKYLEAFAVFEKLPKDFGGSFRASRKAEVLLRLGRIDEAGLRVQQALEKFPNEPYVNSVAAILYAARGEKKLAEERIKISSRTGETLGHFHHVAYNLGVACALMNNRAEAIRWLQKTTEDGLHCFPLFANDPYLNNLRSDPQFKLFLGAEQDRWEGYNATL